MSEPYLSKILLEVSEEGDRAREKFGDQFDRDDVEWLAILAEEFGEAAKEVVQLSIPPITHGDRGARERAGDLRAEAIQIAATAARWIASMDEFERNVQRAARAIEP